MKKKGFTLIELLAVIVILAIIALIAIPLVLKYIQASRDEARLRSAENYLDAVEKAVVNQNMQGKKFNPNVCNVKDEKLYCDGTLLDVSIKGVKPDNSSVITFHNGKIDRVKLLYEDKIIVDNEKDILVYGEDIEIVPAGLYDDNNSLLASWDELVNKYGLNIEANYTFSNYKTSGSMYAVLNNNLNLSSATKVIVKDGITKIGNYVFYSCNNLKKVILSDTVLTIGESAFSHCNELEYIYIPDMLTSIGKHAFMYCKKLDNIIIPSGVTSILDNVFYDCASLSSIHIHKDIASIDSAFYGCKNLDKITVDEENPIYDSRDNSNAIIETATNTLVAGSNNTVIPNSVTSIADYAFQGRSKMKSLYIPKSVTSIGVCAFNNMRSLEKIIVEEGNSVYDSRDNSNAIIETATNTLLFGSNGTVIPDTVTSISRGAFWGAEKLEIINIPDSVTSIGTLAFYECKSLKKITIPDKVTELKGSTFASCINLEEVIISSNVSRISTGLFSGCNNLKTIYYKGLATGAPWGATNATVISGY